MADIQQWRDGFQNYVKGMSLTQRASIGGTLVLILLAFILMMRWITKPDYALLYSDLELKEADQIIELLRTQNVPYKLTGNGSGIMIPSKEVYEWRMQLASQGLPTTSGIGYEIFDKKDIGISDFVQEVNYRRALEGELSRTISGISGIQAARVHIVIPKARLFRESQEDPTASVVLSMGGHMRLSEHQIMGISHMVASSVEGLVPKNVTIVDSRGHVLSNEYEADSAVGVSASQLDLQRKVESTLEKKAETMLARVVGQEKAIVRVSAQLNFEKREQTDEQYDADNVAILSEQLDSEESTDVNGLPSGTKEHTITNYQVPKTIRHVTSSIGDIQRLSVAVLVDGNKETVTDEEGVETEEYIPRTNQEMAQLAAVVRSAVGFNPIRGDQLEIRNIEFSDPTIEMEIMPVDPTAQREFWFSIAQRAAPVILIIALLFILRSRLKQIKVTMPGQSAGVPGQALQVAGEAAGAAGGDGSVNFDEIPVPKIDENVAPEAVESAKLLKQISAFAGEKPTLAARLLRYWMIEE